MAQKPATPEHDGALLVAPVTEAADTAPAAAFAPSAAALAARSPAQRSAAAAALHEAAGNASVARALSVAREPGRCACGGTIGADGMCDKCRSEGRSEPAAEVGDDLALHSRPEANDAVARMLAADRRG